MNFSRHASRITHHASRGYELWLVSVALAICLLAGRVAAAEPWQEALAKMPFTGEVAELTKTNFAEVLLGALRPDATVKALVLVPGATDEFYFFNRAKVTLTNRVASLLDLVTAVTNQTFIRATFRPPLLLLHTEEDPTEPLLRVEDEAAARQLRGRKFAPHFLYNDRDWNFVHPILDRTLTGRFTGWPEFLPPPRTPESWHFFRHSVAGWNLTGWEALEVLSLAGKTTVTIQKRRVIFQGDTRVGKLPGSSQPAP